MFASLGVISLWAFFDGKPPSFKALQTGPIAPRINSPHPPHAAKKTKKKRKAKPSAAAVSNFQIKRQGFLAV
jgi:hypothetical protein